MVADDPETFADLDGHCCVAEGAEAGAEIGEFFGPAGAVIGGTVGAAAGAYLGWKAADLLPTSNNGSHAWATDEMGAMSQGMAAEHLQKFEQAQKASDANSTTSQQSTPAEPSDGSNGLPKSPTGKGSIPPDQRDPKRTATKAEKAEKLQGQGGTCANCRKDIPEGEGIGHHEPRHADGGRTPRDVVIVCKECHKELHSKQPENQ